MTDPGLTRRVERLEASCPPYWFSMATFGIALLSLGLCCILFAATPAATKPSPSISIVSGEDYRMAQRELLKLQIEQLKRDIARDQAAVDAEKAK